MRSARSPQEARRPRLQQPSQNLVTSFSNNRPLVHHGDIFQCCCGLHWLCSLSSSVMTLSFCFPPHQFSSLPTSSVPTNSCLLWPLFYPQFHLFLSLEFSSCMSSSLFSLEAAKMPLSLSNPCSCLIYFYSSFSGWVIYWSWLPCPKIMDFHPDMYVTSSVTPMCSVVTDSCLSLCLVTFVCVHNCTSTYCHVHV